MNWLKDMANAIDAKGATAAAWKLLHYGHPQPDPALATQPQLEAMQCFKAWQKALTRGQLLMRCWVEVLGEVATKQAEAEERAAATAAVVKWSSWLREGPANGLRRQHQHTRVATGWTQAAVSKGEETEVGEREDMDGLS